MGEFIWGRYAFVGLHGSRYGHFCWAVTIIHPYFFSVSATVCRIIWTRVPRFLAEKKRIVSKLSTPWSGTLPSRIYPP